MTSMYDPPPACGTVRGHLAHLHRGEPSCTWCRDAWAEFSATVPGNGYHQRHIAMPTVPATQGCASCRRELGVHDYSMRQWQTPAGVCKDCAATALRGRLAAARATRAAKRTVTA